MKPGSIVFSFWHVVKLFFVFSFISLFLSVQLGCNKDSDSSRTSSSSAYFKLYQEVPLTVPKSNVDGTPATDDNDDIVTKIVGGEAVAIFDANGDDTEDIVIVSADPYYSVILNEKSSSGSFSFNLQTPAVVGKIDDAITNNPASLGLHDFNNDGFLDLYFGNYGKGTIRLKNPRYDYANFSHIDFSGTDLDGFNTDSDNLYEGGLYRDNGYRSYISKGDGTFEYFDINANADGTTRSSVFADFDGDGYFDMFASNAAYFGISWGGSSSPNELRKGQSDGSFGPDIIDSVVTNDADSDLWYDTDGRANKDYKGMIARDFDGDGKPDIIISAIADIWDAVQDLTLGVWTQDPLGDDVDLDGDSLGDGGYQGKWRRGILVLRNTSSSGSINFEDVSETAIDNYPGTTDQMHTYITIPADIDNDGDLDLLVSGPKYFFAHNSYEYDTDRIRVYRNDSTPGNMKFTNITADSGLDVLNDDTTLSDASFGSYPVILPKAMVNGDDAVMTPLFSAGAALDIDNDGDMDWVSVDRQLLGRNPYNNEEFFCWVFLNDGQGHFEIISPSKHGLSHTGRDLSYADLNQDGKLDLVIVNDSGGGQSVDSNNYIYFNNIQNSNHWINIRLNGPSNNVLGLGTKVTVFKAGTTEILGYEELRTDFAYRSKRPASLHFGLGSEESVDVKLVFPDGVEKTVTGLAVDQRHTLEY